MRRFGMRSRLSSIPLAAALAGAAGPVVGQATDRYTSFDSGRIEWTHHVKAKGVGADAITITPSSHNYGDVAAPNGLAMAGDSLLTSNASRALFELMMSCACCAKRSSPCTRSLLDSWPLNAVSRSLSNRSRRPTD